MRHTTLRYLLATLVVGGVLAGCTALDHLDSQKRLEQGVDSLFAAEHRAYVLAKEGKGAAIAPDETFENSIGPTPEAARLALLADAKRDVAAVDGITADAGTLDRISYFYRAAIKVWHSGDAETGLAAEIAQKGKSACETVNPPQSKPPRDCGMFDLVVPLTLAEAATDRYNDVELERLRAGATWPSDKKEPDLIAILNDYRVAIAGDRVLDAQSHGLADVPTGKTGVLETFVDRQLAIYWCYASLAKLEEENISASQDQHKQAASAYDAVTQAARARKPILVVDGNPVPYCTALANKVAEARAKALGTDPASDRPPGL